MSTLVLFQNKNTLWYCGLNAYIVKVLAACDKTRNNNKKKINIIKFKLSAALTLKHRIAKLICFEVHKKTHMAMYMRRLILKEILINRLIAT